MELIELRKVIFHDNEINTFSINDYSLEYFFIMKQYYSNFDKEKYQSNLSSMLNFINKKEKHIISRFYVKSDKNRLRLFKDKSKRQFLNEAFYNNEIDTCSLLSLLRFYDFLPKINRKYSLHIKNNIFVLDIKNTNNILLQLRFLNNGNVDFLSLDEDSISEDDHKTYVIKGSFSTSEYIDKSYKINRLLNILYE